MRKYVLLFDSCKFSETGEVEIMDETTGEHLTLEEAKKVAEIPGALDNASMSFYRLIQNNFDLDKLKEFYNE